MNAMIYVQATEVGGTHPALVEAMRRGACIAANDVSEHPEVLGHAGEYCVKNDSASLAAALNALVHAPEQRRRLQVAAIERARRLFSWDRVADEYERVFLDLAQR